MTDAHKFVAFIVTITSVGWGVWVTMQIFEHRSTLVEMREHV